MTTPDSPPPSDDAPPMHTMPAARLSDAHVDGLIARHEGAERWLSRRRGVRRFFFLLAWPLRQFDWVARNGKDIIWTILAVASAMSFADRMGWIDLTLLPTWIGIAVSTVDERF